MTAMTPLIDAAASVRHAVLLTPGVADLSQSAAFQTCGPGRTVRGVALEAVPDGARVFVGVVIEDDDRPLTALARSVRTAAEAAWARARVEDEAGAPVALEVTVHVVDMAEDGRSED